MMEIKIKPNAIYLYLSDGPEYCNGCRFLKYVNRDIRHACILGHKFMKEGANFIRPGSCKQIEVK